MLATPTPKQIVFVDCENVPSFDLTAIADKPVQIRLVVGKQQKQVGIEVLRTALLGQVELIEAGASGHNALDIILAAHLGRAWALNPNVEFVIVSGTLAAPREVFHGAIVAGASAMIVAHNHPSGDPSPSTADVKVTRSLRDASRILEIELLDHVIVGDAKADPQARGLYSFREAGLL